MASQGLAHVAECFVRNSALNLRRNRFPCSISGLGLVCNLCNLSLHKYRDMFPHSPTSIARIEGTLHTANVVKTFVVYLPPPPRNTVMLVL